MRPRRISMMQLPPYFQGHEEPHRTLLSLRLSFRYFTLKPPGFLSHCLHWPPPNIWTKALVQVVESQLINVTFGTATQISHSSPGLRAHDNQEPGQKACKLEKVEDSPFIWYLAVVAVRKNQSNKAFGLSTILPPATSEHPRARYLHSPITPLPHRKYGQRTSDGAPRHAL